MCVYAAVCLSISCLRDHACAILGAVQVQFPYHAYHACAILGGRSSAISQTLERKFLCCEDSETGATARGRDRILERNDRDKESRESHFCPKASQSQSSYKKF